MHCKAFHTQCGRSAQLGYQSCKHNSTARFVHCCTQYRRFKVAASSDGQSSSLVEPQDVQTATTPVATPPAASFTSRLLQNYNPAGISLFLQLLGGDRTLSLPHLTVHDIRHIDWAALATIGFRGVVFDKDNTLSRPFVPHVEPSLLASLEACKVAFEGRLVLYSNSAGLLQYDPHGEEAAALEASTGVHVLRHREKKPAGGAAEIAAHFSCPPQHLLMVGDRYLTDIVFGNRHGMLTVRPTPLTLEGEPLTVSMARKLEEHFVKRWLQNTEPRAHPLLVASGRAAGSFVKDPNL